MMLETIREYGREVLAASGEMEAIQHAHAAFYLALAEEAAPELRGPQQALWLKRLEREYANLRAAMQWFLAQEMTGPGREMALRLSGALWDFWVVRGLYSEGRAFLEQALASSAGVAASVRARALSAAADFALFQSDVDRSEALRQESLVLYREIGDTRGSASSSWQLAWVASRRKGADFAAAQSLHEESLSLYQEVGDKDAIAWSLQSRAGFVCTQGEYSRGRALYEESLAMYRELGNKRGILACLQGLVLWLIVALDDQSTVRAGLEESLALCREVGDKDGIAFYYWLAACEALVQGDKVAAHALVEQSLALGREMAAPWRTTWALGLLGRIETQQGGFASARALHEEGLAIAKTLNNDWLTAFCLEGLAIVVAAQREKTWAARLGGTAESLRESSGVILTPFERADYEPAVAAARAQLGEKIFAAAWLEGRAMTPEQAFAAREPLMVSTPVPVLQPPTPPAKKSHMYPAGLTAREIEVLRLVAQGLTDAQVAEQLVISPRTVNWYLTAIYSKLQVSSRSAATRYAVEHHLL